MHENNAWGQTLHFTLEEERGQVLPQLIKRVRDAGGQTLHFTFKEMHKEMHGVKPYISHLRK